MKIDFEHRGFDCRGNRGEDGEWHVEVRDDTGEHVWMGTWKDNRDVEDIKGSLKSVVNYKYPRWKGIIND